MHVEKTSNCLMLIRLKLVLLPNMVNESCNRIATVLFRGIWEVLMILNGSNWIKNALSYVYKKPLVKLFKTKVTFMPTHFIPIFRPEMVLEREVALLYWFLCIFKLSDLSFTTFLFYVWLNQNLVNYLLLLMHIYLRVILNIYI